MISRDFTWCFLTTLVGGSLTDGVTPFLSLLFHFFKFLVKSSWRKWSVQILAVFVGFSNCRRSIHRFFILCWASELPNLGMVTNPLCRCVLHEGTVHLYCLSIVLLTMSHYFYRSDIDSRNALWGASHIWSSTVNCAFSNFNLNYSILKRYFSDLDWSKDFKRLTLKWLLLSNHKAYKWKNLAISNTGRKVWNVEVIVICTTCSAEIRGIKQHVEATIVYMW